jgi:hypothetical protein
MFKNLAHPTRRTLAAVGLLMPLTLAAAACGSGGDEDLAEAAATPAATASAPEGSNAPRSDAGSGDCTDKCTTSIIVTIANNSSHTLDFAGNESNTPENPNNTKPKSSLAPGETDSFQFKTSLSSGVLYEPYWVIENGGGDTLHTFFQVPTVGGNTVSCADNIFTEPSRLVAATCTMQKHSKPNYHPVVNMVWTDK